MFITIVIIFIICSVFFFIKRTERMSDNCSSPNLPIEPLEVYLDRVYGPTPYGVRRICDRLFDDKRLIGDSSQYTAICYCMIAMSNEECRCRLSDDDRWVLLYDLRTKVDIIVRCMDVGNSYEDKFKQCRSTLAQWMDDIHHIPIFISDVMARMRRSESPESSGIDWWAMQDDLDALRRRCNADGHDWD